MTPRWTLTLLLSLALTACGRGGPKSTDAAVEEGAGTVANRAPLASDDQVDVESAAPIDIFVLQNDRDADGDTLNLLSVGAPTSGAVLIMDNGTPADGSDDFVRFTPPPGFSASALFSYTIGDGANGRSSGSVTVVFADPNNPGTANAAPKPLADAAETLPGASVVIDVLDNDADPDGDVLTLLAVSAAAHGQVFVDDGGTASVTTDDRVIYLPAPGYSGSDSFRYTVSDGFAAVEAAVNVNVQAANVLPPAQVCGVVMIGPVAGAQVALYAMDAGGEAAGAPLAQIVTDSVGQWCLTLPVTRDDLLVVSEGGAYFDPADSGSPIEGLRVIDLSAGSFSAVLFRDADVSALTPLSSALLRKARREADRDNFATVMAANRSQSQAAFGFDPFATLVANPLDPRGAAPEAASYAMVTGATAGAVNRLAVAASQSSPDAGFVGALIADLSDCRLDGREDGQVVELSIDGVATPIADNLSLNLEILRFRNNGADAYATTPLVQVDEARCAASARQGDTTAPVITQLPDDLILVEPTGMGVALSDPRVQTFLAGARAEDNRDDIVTTRPELTDGSPLPAVLPVGVTRVQFVATDAAGNTALSAARTLRVTLAPGPVANPDSATGSEDAALVIDLLANDIVAGGSLDPASVTVSAHSGPGTLLIDPATGRATVTPPADFFGPVTFRYAVADNGGLASNTTSVTADFVALFEDAPRPVDDLVAGVENASVRVHVLQNDSDPDPDGLVGATVSVIGPPADGSAVVDPADNAIVYTPVLNFDGSDTVVYRVTDAAGNVSAAATLTISLSGVNTPPLASDASVGATEDAALTAPLPVSDVDSAIDYSSFALLTAPANGTVFVDAGGDFNYTPVGDYFGSDSFRFTVADTAGALSNPAVVTITIAPVADDPVAGPDSAATSEGLAVRIAVTSNDADADGDLDPASVQILTLPASGSVVVEANGDVTYQPAGASNGSDVFSYRVADGRAVFSSAASVTIAVTPVNTAPVASDQSLVTDEDQVLVAALAVSDVDSAIDHASFALLTSAANGTVVADGAGGFTYTPNPDFFGADSFRYTLADVEGLLSNVATVALSVAAVADDPVALADNASTDEAVAVRIAVLANDGDVDGDLDATSVAIVSAPTRGSAVVEANGDVTYTPTGTSNGTDGFGYRVADARGVFSAAATVTVNVAPVNTAPLTAAQNLATDEDTALVAALSVTDVDSAIDYASFTLLTPPVNGGVTADGAGGFTYTPDAEFAGGDSFVYVVADAEGLVSNAGTVTLSVVVVDDDPLTQSDAVTTDEAVTVRIGVLANDSDADGDLDPSSVEIVTAPTRGSAVVESNGDVTYTPSGTLWGADSFAYRVADARGVFSAATSVTVDVLFVDDPPLARDDSARTLEDTTITVAILANDSDPDTAVDPASVVVTTSPFGTLSVNPANGDIDYTPVAGFVGVDTAGYTVADMAGHVSATALVSITVWPGEDPDFDGVGRAIENAVGTDPDAADSAYVFIDPAANPAFSDGASWQTAFVDLQSARLAGALQSTPGNWTYVLLADNSATTVSGINWSVDLNGNCDNLIFVGGLGYLVATPKQDGNGRPATRLQSVNAGARPLRVRDCDGVWFVGLRMTGGNAVDDGGGVLIEDSLVTLDSVQVHDNAARRFGGGISVLDGGGALPSNLTLRNSLVATNLIVTTGGATGSGGGLYAGVNSTIDVSATRFVGNRIDQLTGTPLTGGGAGLFAGDADLRVDTATFAGNVSNTVGGGLALTGSTTIMQINNSIISGNEARLRGGGVYLNGTGANTRLHNNLLVSNLASAGGGAYASNALDTLIMNNTAVFNVANDGGALFLDTTSPALNDNIAQRNFAANSGSNIGGNVFLLGSLNASNNLLDSGFAGLVGFNNSALDAQFDVGYYLDHASAIPSPAIDYSLTFQSADAGVGLDERYTDASGATTDVLALDSGYHYAAPSPGVANAGQLSILELKANGSNQRFRLRPTVGGVPLGPGRRVYVSSPNAALAPHLFEQSTYIRDPLGTGRSTEARDLGDGWYEVLMDSDGSGSYTVDVWVDITAGAPSVRFLITLGS